MSDQATAAAQPLQPSFEQAIEVADLWCHAWEQGELSDEVLADRVAELVASRDGARGFFVVSLPADNPLMDRLPLVVVVAPALQEGQICPLPPGGGQQTLEAGFNQGRLKQTQQLAAAALHPF